MKTFAYSGRTVMRPVNHRFLLVLMAVILCVGNASANPRTKGAIRDAALQVLGGGAYAKGMPGSPSPEQLVELSSDSLFTVMGYKSGGFAIISNDDQLPEVVGYSDSKYDEGVSNPGFDWFMKSVKIKARKVIAGEESVEDSKPSSKYAESVPSFIKTKWSQGEPYNNMCPVMDSLGTRALTGCGATALAQVLYYYKYPVHGENISTASVIYADGSESTISVDLSKSSYDYSDMLTNYSKNKGTVAQKSAISKLMFDSGIALSSSYEPKATGVYWNNLINGMKNNFGFENIKAYDKEKTEPTEWKNIIFNELTEKRPVIFDGDNGEDGHLFILDGYDKDGNVHVNWGWGGIFDGYYDMSFTNIDLEYWSTNLNYQYAQSILIGIEPPKTVNGVNRVTAAATDNTGERYYNLNGQQVSPNYHGIVIQNGKKFVR